jgi:2-phospho-L-lactate transferase/gluconeogenesis factor (CofD/UPF0052 family)
MTKFGQTYGLTAREHLETLEKYLGKGTIDIVLVNKGDKFPKRILERYEEESAFPVKDDLGSPANYKVIRRRLNSERIFEKPKSDTLIRSLIRHDPAKLARALTSLL